MQVSLKMKTQHLLVQLKELLLGGHISVVQIIAAHLVLVLQQHLSIGERGGVLDVLEVLHPLLTTHGYQASFFNEQ